MPGETALEGKVLIPRKQIVHRQCPPVWAVLEQWLLTGCARASPSESCLHSQRPDTAEAKPHPQLVRAGRVCVSAVVLPLLSPNQVLRNRHYRLHVIMMNSGFIF